LTVKDILEGMIMAHEIQGGLALENSYNRVGLDHVVCVQSSQLHPLMVLTMKYVATVSSKSLQLPLPLNYLVSTETKSLMSSLKLSLMDNLFELTDTHPTLDPESLGPPEMLVLELFTSPCSFNVERWVFLPS
jgi:hypothetical protein